VEQRRAERVEIAARVDGAAELFDRHVAEGADERAAVGDLFEQLARDAEIHQRERSVGAQNEVGGLHVAVEHAALVQVGEHVQCLPRECFYVLGLQGPTAQPRRERLALDQLLREIEPQVDSGSLAERADEARDRRVLELRQHARLALEGVDRLRIGREREDELFQGDLAAVGRAGPVDAAMQGLREKGLDTESTGRRRSAARIAARPGKIRPTNGTDGHGDTLTGTP